MRELLFSYYYNNSQQRAYWIDYVKGLAIILVVLGHLAGGLVNSGLEAASSMVQLNHELYFLRMPVFFIISGMFFRKSIGKRSWKGFTQNKFDTIFYPYLIWAFIQLTVQLLLSNYVNSSKNLSYYLYIITNPGGGRIDQFWYLYVLFFLNIFYLGIDSFIKNKYYHIPIGLTLLFVSEFVVDITLLHGVSFYYLFFALGDNLAGTIWDKHNFDKLQSYKYFLPFLIVFIAALMYWHHQEARPNPFVFFILGTIGGLFFIMSAIQMQKTDPIPIIRFIGYHSLYIYIWHLLAGTAMRAITVKILNIENVYLVLPIITLAGIFLPIFAYSFIVKFKLQILVENQWNKIIRQKKTGKEVIA